MKGRLGGFLKGNFDVLLTFSQVLRKRKQVMRLKRVRDRDLLTGKSIDLTGDVPSSGIVRIGLQFLNQLFKLYWLLIRRIV